MNLIEVLKSRNYTIVYSKEELFHLDLDKTKNVVGLFSAAGMSDIPDRSPTLSEMTQKALEILSRDKDGFFLMVEGSQIDWKGHDNMSKGMILETIEFDDAVAVGVEFARENPGTLIVVTSDHETGGAAVLHGSLSQKSVGLSFLTGDHTGNMVPLFASGPGAKVFHGIIDNTFIGQKLIEYVKNRPHLSH